FSPAEAPLEPARSVAVAPAEVWSVAVAAAEVRPTVIATAELRSTKVAPATAAHPSENGEAPLLAIVEALVERVGGVGELLECGAGIRHRAAPLAQAINWIEAARLRVAAFTDE